MEGPASQATTGFREEFASWLKEAFVSDIAEALCQGDAEGRFDAHREWNAVLFDAGFAAPRWPERFGGRDASLLDELACNEEMARVGAPGPVNAIGVSNIAPAIRIYGSEAQQQRFLRPMLRGDEIWSQGMSEPEAGSDLASLKCSARVNEYGFVVNGQKTWNSNGHRADWCQLFVRTGPQASRHAGITALLVDMSLPGIEARPILTMAGGSEFSELFFTDVEVPASALLGEVNSGWAVATKTLSHERAGVASLYLSLQRSFLELSASVSRRGPLSAVMRDELATRYTEVKILEYLARRSIASALRGAPTGPEGSVIKLAWSQAGQALARTTVDAFGMAGLTGSAGDELARSRSQTIAGGTTEVNENIIGERVLGLPREPKPPHQNSRLATGD